MKKEIGLKEYILQLGIAMWVGQVVLNEFVDALYPNRLRLFPSARKEEELEK